MTEGYQLVQLRNGTWSVRSLEAAETFHPVVGPVEEAEALYVRQLRLPERFKASTASSAGSPFVIWDVGLGAAANVLVVLRSLSGIPGTVRILSFDHTLAPLRFAASQSERLGYFAGYGPPVDTLLETGRSEFRTGALDVVWEVFPGDFPTLVSAPGAGSWARPNAILYDAYSPARNPAMWTLPLFTRLRQLADPEAPCSLATYSRATLLRVTLLNAGWFVGVGLATGEKDETTLAANQPELIHEPLGASWLKRAFRSTSAEPLTGPEYRQDPLSESGRAALSAHPQFSVAVGTPPPATAQFQARDAISGRLGTTHSPETTTRNKTGNKTVASSGTDMAKSTA